MMKDKMKPDVYVPTRKLRIRDGRGFSQEEIKRAGLTLQEAKRLEIPIDGRRSTTHPQNIQTLKESFGKPMPLSEISGIGKTTEAKLKKAGILDAHDLAYVDINTIAEETSFTEKALTRWKAEARRLLGKQQIQKKT
ncbi:MAG: ribosomal protein L13e [Candidatus Bathyarchaeota archaeon]|nr:MAG: ribosomal protein L13e [Candidatus Bathyarchaeota archaeon]